MTVYGNWRNSKYIVLLIQVYLPLLVLVDVNSSECKICVSFGAKRELFFKFVNGLTKHGVSTAKTIIDMDTEQAMHIAILVS